MATQSDSGNIIIDGYVTLAFINQYYYNVSNNNNSSNATQALYKSDNQSVILKSFGSATVSKVFPSEAASRVS
jgi:hypothetical protein